MNERWALDWLWWLIASLLTLWWWPRHVAAAFRPQTTVSLSEITVAVATPSPAPIDPPQLELITANWGWVTDSVSRPLWQLAEDGTFIPLRGCHLATNLEEPRDPTSPCQTSTTEKLAVPTSHDVYYQHGQDFVYLAPSQVEPSEAGQLLITEVMWMGSYHGDISLAGDEWLEIFNTTETTLNLSGIEITQAGAAGHSLFFPDGAYLPPLSYALVGAEGGANTQLATDPDWIIPQMSLSNTYAGLTVLTSTGLRLDALPAGPWRAGLNNTTQRQRFSAQRKSYSAPGDAWDNWAHCSVELLPFFDLSGWKVSDVPHNCGTPWQDSLF